MVFRAQPIQSYHVPIAAAAQINNNNQASSESQGMTVVTRGVTMQHYMT